MWRWTACCLSSSLLLALAGCPGGGAGDDDGVDAGPTGNCARETSKDKASAVPLAADAPFDGMLCPLGDVDWFEVEVPAGMDLLDVTATYANSLTKVDLSVQLYQEDGVTPVPLAALADSRLDDNRSEIVSTLKIPAPGRYYLVLRDSGDDERDDVNHYALTVSTAKDPDGHEPNDTPATAATPDGAPAYFAYQGDLDYYAVSVPSGSSLVQLVLDNPATNSPPLEYRIEDTAAETVAEGSVSSATTLDTLRAVPGAGQYYVVVSGGPDARPSRDAAAAYTLSVSALPEPDGNEGGSRNDDGVTATCLGGGPGACTTFGGSDLTYPTKTGRIGSAGDRDFYRLDVSSVAAVVEFTAQIGASTPVDLAVDLLAPHAASTCTADEDCVAIDQSCSQDTDCELSHVCLPEGQYHFCPAGSPCRRCAGASACVPSTGDRSGPRVCAVTQATVRDEDGGAAGDNVVRSAQPLLAAGPYYLVVHDFQDNAFDYDRDYTFAVKVVPELDAGDSDPAARNNFYDPYPLASTELWPNKARAIDIDGAIAAGSWVTGYISYPSDQDWFSFSHPCPGADCGLVWEFTQPGPSPVLVAFLMRNEGLGIHESWMYLGSFPTSGPVTELFGDGAGCDECSFAWQQDSGRYYIQVRDYEMNDWDGRSGHSYGFRLASKGTGCPANCTPSDGCGGPCP